MPYALCPMPYALDPRAPHVTEKGYKLVIIYVACRQYQQLVRLLLDHK